MRKILAGVVLLLTVAPSAYAQGSVDAESVYLGTYGGTVCRMRTGSGAPSGGTDCDVYLRNDAGNERLYQKIAGTWVLTARVNSRPDLPTEVAYTDVGNVFTNVQRITANGENIQFDAATSTRETYTRWNNGTATMLAGVESSAGGQLFVGTSAYAGVYGTQSNHPLIFATNNTNRVTIDANGHLTPYLDETADLGSAFKTWRKGYISEIQATLFAKETQTLYGGWLSVSKNAGTLAASVNDSQTTVDFGMAMTLNQFVLIRAADNAGGTITHEYMKVGTLVSGTTYNVTRNLSGIGAKFWAQGTPFQVRGVAGDGWIELNAFDTPRMSVFTQGSLYNNSTENIRIGHLTGMPNSSSGIGIYIGDATDFFRYDSTDLTLRSAGVTIDDTGIGLATTGSESGLNAYKFLRDTTKGFGGAGDQYGLYNSTTCIGGGCAQTDDLTIRNVMKGVGSNLGRANIIISASGWNSGTLASLTEESISILSNQTPTAGIYLSGTALYLNAPVTTNGSIKERSRATAMGEWTTPTFAGGNFTASTGTWTVDAGDVTTYAYTLVGKTMTVMFTISTTDVSAAPAQLLIAIPGGHLAAKQTRSMTNVIDAGAAPATGVAIVQAGASQIILVSTAAGGAWTTTAADNTHVFGTVTFEIQ